MTLHTSWNLEETAARRDRYYSASQRKFVPFRDPMVSVAGRCNISGMRRAGSTPTFWG